jgi:hypothetical protein
MAYELMYTSVPRGLRPGTSGFCTVAHTAGMPAPLIRSLETLSSYRPDEMDARLPALSHWRLPAARGVHSVLSSVRPAELDHTRRATVLAHHIVLHAQERSVDGPASVMATPGLFAATWGGTPRILPAELRMSHDGIPPVPGVDTQIGAGDAGWTKFVAEALLKSDPRPVVVIIPRECDALPWARTVIALIPAPRRWEVTFCTRFTAAAPAGLSCALRFVPVDSPAARLARQGRGGLRVLLDMTQGKHAGSHGAASD